jgi:autotransporter-associated beta strand protein
MKMNMFASLILLALPTFAGWIGTGVPSGTGDNRINLVDNWTGGVIDGDFSAITTEGTNALVLTANLTFSEGASKVMGVSFASNSVAIAFTSVVGVAVGQTINGTSIPYNTHLIALSDTNGTLSRATTGLPSGSYTLARPALDFDFGTYAAARGTNVIVTIGSDTPGTPRTLTFSGRLCLSQYTLPANRVIVTPDVTVSAANGSSITREAGLANTGAVTPAAIFNGPLFLGNYGAATTCFTLDGGDLTVNGLVSGANARINVYSSGFAGTLTLTNPTNTFSGGLTAQSGGNLVVNSPTATAATGSPSAIGGGGAVGLNNTRYTFTGFTAKQLCDRAFNIGGNAGSTLVNNGAAPIEFTGIMRNNVSTYAMQLAGSYANRGSPNVISGYVYNNDSGGNILGVNVQGGIWRLTNPTNAYTGTSRVSAGNGATLQFTSLANTGVKSALGSGSLLQFESGGGGSTLLLEYIGTNNVTCNRELRLTGNSSDGGYSALTVNGLGRLELTGLITNGLTANSGGLGTRALQLTGTGAGVLSGWGGLGDVISGSNTGRVSIYKLAFGAWTISGTNFNHSGITAVRSGTLSLDYTAGDPLALPAANVALQGGSLRVAGRPAGTTADTYGTFQVGDGQAQFRCSSLTLDSNGGDGVALTVDKLEGDAKTQKLDFFDFSSSANNSLTVNSLGTLSPVVNGVVMNNATNLARASLILKTSAGLGFPALSGGTSGALQLLGGLTPFPSSGYANSANYELTAGTVAPSATVNFNTLTVDSSAGAVALNLGANSINATGQGKGLLLKGSNPVTFTGTGTGAHVNSAIWFHNFLSGGAAFTFNGNLGTGQVTLWGNGGGLSVYGGTGFGNGLILGRGVFRVTAAQTFASTGRTAISDGAVFELGADLNGAAAGDLSCNLAAASSAMTLYFNSGFSAWGADRVVNIGGNLTSLVWGSGGFLVFPADDTTVMDGGFAFKLSSPYANATVEVQNPIDLNGNGYYGRIRTVDVANGSAAVDARLSGVLSGNASFAKTGAGTLELSGAQTYDGPLLVMEGTVRFGADNLVTNGLIVQLRGGGLATSIGTNTLGRLELYADGTLSVGDGTASLAFADSSAAAWSGTLTITGTLLPNTLRIGTDANGLTAAQLAAIKNGSDKVGITPDGYLYRIPSGTLIRVM